VNRDDQLDRNLGGQAGPAIRHGSSPPTVPLPGPAGPVGVDGYLRRFGGGAAKPADNLRTRNRST
jgi:hypothetical protein